MALEGKTPEEIQALAALADDVLSKPETAGVFQRLIKRNNPNVSMPLVELEDRARAAFVEQNKQLEKISGQLAQTEAEKQANMLYEGLRDAGIVTSRASFAELVTYASQNGFMTTEQGLRRAAMQKQDEQAAAEPTPQTVGHGVFSLGKGEDGTDFMKDPIGAGRTVAAKAMDELRKQRSNGRQSH